MNKKVMLYGKVIYYLLILSVAFFSGIFGAVFYESKLKTQTNSNTSSNVSTTNTSSDNKTDTADTVEQVADCVVDVSAENSIGSGVVYSKDGYIITNEHVIRKAKK